MHVCALYILHRWATSKKMDPPCTTKNVDVLHCTRRMAMAEATINRRQISDLPKFFMEFEKNNKRWKRYRIEKVPRSRKVSMFSVYILTLKMAKICGFDSIVICWMSMSRPSSRKRKVTDMVVLPPYKTKKSPKTKVRARRHAPTHWQIVQTCIYP